LQSSEALNQIPEKKPRHQFSEFLFGDEAPILAEEKLNNGKKRKKADGEEKKEKSIIQNLESRGVEISQENIQCLNSDAAARKEVINFEKKEKNFPYSPGGECQKVSFVALDQLSENTHEDESKRQSISEITTDAKNRAGNPNWGRNGEMFVAKSFSPQIQSFSTYSIPQNDQKKYFCLPEMIKTNDQNVEPQKNNFIYKSTYEAKLIEKAQTSKILVTQERKLSEGIDVKDRKSDASSNHLTQTINMRNR
jgi:hypothetical protein